MALAPIPERLAVKLSLPILKTNVCPDRGSNHLLWHGTSIFVKVLQRATPTMTRDLYICEGSSACHTYYDTGPWYLWRFFSVPHLLWHGTSVFVKILQRATPTMTQDLCICEGSSASHTYYDRGPRYLWRFFRVTLLLWHGISVFVKVLQRVTLTMTRDLCICEGFSAYHSYYDTGPRYLWTSRFFSVPLLLWHRTSVFVKVLQRTTPTMTRDLGIWEGSSACHSYYDTGPLYLWRFFSVPHLLWHGTSVLVVSTESPITFTPLYVVPGSAFVFMINWQFHE